MEKRLLIVYATNEQDGKPIDGAWVGVSDVAGKTLYETTTNAKGFKAIDLDPSHPIVNVAIGLDGFREHQVEKVGIGDEDMPQTLFVQLQPLAGDPTVTAASSVWPPYPGVILRRGMQGPSIRQVQERLNQLGANPRLATDGVFGPATEAAVRAFQSRNGLNADGVVGPNTWNALFANGGTTPPPGNLTYTVVAGDNLWSIAQRFGTTMEAIMQLNGLTSTLIHPGQVLRIPTSTPPSGFNYTVVAGDNLWSIAQRFGTTMEAIMQLNGLTSTLIHPGQVLRIPSGSGGTTPPPPQRRYTIVIDPGHGGSDPGAVANGRREADDVLRLSLAVQRLLEAQGQRVIMTRTTDTFVPLAERSAISNRNNADLFVSIHRNSNTNPSINGVDNFVFTTAPQHTVQIAFNVIDQVADTGVQSNRGVMRANFAVLRNTTAPAMLLEMGFITNLRDNQLFDQNLNAYAAAISRGILDGLNSQQPPQTTYTATSGDTMWTISQRFGTTPDAIMRLNKLTSNMVIPGQVLRIPG